MTVSPRARLGLGQRLYEAAERFCVQDGGYKKMWLETSRRQKAARVVYLRNGWA
jgi:GNAT superfamily N-acetyltransferase